VPWSVESQSCLILPCSPACRCSVGATCFLLRLPMTGTLPRVQCASVTAHEHCNAKEVPSVAPRVQFLAGAPCGMGIRRSMSWWLGYGIDGGEPCLGSPIIDAFQCYCNWTVLHPTLPRRNISPLSPSLGNRWCLSSIVPHDMTGAVSLQIWHPNSICHRQWALVPAAIFGASPRCPSGQCACDRKGVQYCLSVASLTWETRGRGLVAQREQTSSV
jgi:hypothetical protein